MIADEWGIPTLDLAMQAETVDLPFVQWGRLPIAREMRGTYHFYQDDRKFSALWKSPLAITRSGCRAAVEPNFSTWPDLPRAVALHDIYRKRTLARSWQQHGIRIWVDLNVDDAFLDLALLGVPDGWRSYAVRKHRGTGQDDINRRLRMACERSGVGQVRFLVVGGDRAMRDQCREYGWAWQPAGGTSCESVGSGIGGLSGTATATASSSDSASSRSASCGIARGSCG
jgi:hypothetical protein